MRLLPEILAELEGRPALPHPQAATLISPEREVGMARWGFCRYLAGAIEADPRAYAEIRMSDGSLVVMRAKK